MQYQIEIPDGVIPAGYEPVEFRVPKQDDAIISDCGALISSASAGEWHYPRLILRKTWTPAAWMPKGCVCKLEGNSWVIHRGNQYYDAKHLAALYGETFDPPPRSPWQL